MAPLPLAPNVFQITTFGTLEGQPCDHVVNYAVTNASGFELAITTALTNADALNWMGTFSALLPPFYTHTSSRGVYLGSLAVPEVNVPKSIVGTSTAEFAPRFSCVTDRHVVPVRGRGKQGRTNVPGPTMDRYNQATGDLTTAGVNDYTAAFTQYFNAVLASWGSGVTGNPFLVVLNRKLGVFNIPTSSRVDFRPNVHRRWDRKLSRHR
jgi:hypothetical protein